MIRRGFISLAWGYLMGHRLARSNARRLHSTIQRVEQQPYDYIPPVRTPRLGGGTTFLCFEPSSTLGPASGTFPNLNAAVITNQQIYMASVNANGNTNTFTLSALGVTNSTVLNYDVNTTYNTGKVTKVQPTGLANVFAVLVQEC